LEADSFENLLRDDCTLRVPLFGDSLQACVSLFALDAQCILADESEEMQQRSGRIAGWILND
jgi:hypothetical protein